MKGDDAVALLREKRPGALFNENFASYLAALPPNTTTPDFCSPRWKMRIRQQSASIYEE
jgi:hypothetical protein